MNTKEKIINWFVEKTGNDIQTITSKTRVNYFEEGWLESLTFIELVVFLENEFAYKFTAEEFQNPAFATIEGLVEIIESKT